MDSSSSSSSSSAMDFGTRRMSRQENGTMLSLSSCCRRHLPRLRRHYDYSSLFTLLVLLAKIAVVLGASVTGAQDATTKASITSSSSSTSPSQISTASFSDNHEQSTDQILESHHAHGSSSTSSSVSFVTKIGNGFERLVVSIDESLALLSQASTASSSGSAATNSPGGGIASSSPTGFGKGTSSTPSSLSATHHHQHECQTVLEQLKELLARTSDYLYKATKGQTYFRQVSILLPPSWANVNCTGSYQGSSRFLFPAEEALNTASISPSAVHHAQSRADIHVTADHPVYIDRPWTLQYGGCGVPGKKISIPVSFLTGGVLGPQGELKARILVREWVKYRYGVFDESGFAFDDKYPLEYINNEGKPVSTACHLNLTNCGDPEKCDVASDDETSSGFSTASSSSNAPYSTTLLTASSSTTETSSSSSVHGKHDVLSLMSLPVDLQANEFCDEHTHVRTTPTKHNFLCDGKSVWEVMKQHPDFKHSHTNNKQTTNKGTTPSSTPSVISAPPPSISFVSAKTSRVIFLLDRTQSMIQNNRWTNLRQSMYRMFHNVPAGVELGVISYTNVSAVTLPLTVAGTSNRDHLHGRVPLRPLTTLPEDACISCALKTAIKLLKTSGETSNPSTIVLFSGSSKLSSKEWEKLSRIVENNNPISTVVVTYDDSIKTGHFSELTKHGELIRISDSDLHAKSKNLEQSQALNNIFLKIINEQLGAPLYKVHSTVQWPNSDWQVRGKFNVEDGLGRDTWVTVTPEQHGDVDGLQLISPTGKEFDLPLNAEGMLTLRVPGVAEPGLWTYTIKYYHNQQPRPISIDVVTEARKPEAISVRFWNTVVRKPELGNTEVVLLYAQVLQAELPVLNANVTAVVRLPNGHHQTQYSNLIVRVPLLDTGSGDPDITWGDGVYSAYFTQLGSLPGVFSVNLQVNDNNGQAVVPVHTNITRGSYDKPSCCGSSVPHIATIPTGTFNRHMIGSSFTVHHSIPIGEDPYPPGRVTDLRVEKIVDSTSEIRLSWTAPGGDFDNGKATKYEIRCYTSRDALTNDNFMKNGILVHASITPEPDAYGVRQSCVVSVPWANDYFYYAIVAVDNARNRGKVSNLVSVYIKETPTSTVKLTDAWEDGALVSNLTSSRSLNLHNQNNQKFSGVFNAGATWFRGLNETELYVVLAGAAVFLILVSTLIVTAVCVRKNKKKTSESPPAYHNIYTDGGANGKSQNNGYPANKKGDEGMMAVNCCWENESTNSSGKDNHEATNKINAASHGISGKMSSYIPASALYPPVTHTNNNGNGNTGSQYRDIYSGNSNDSSSVGSKPSEGGSEATTHLTHDSASNAHQLHNNVGSGHISPSYYPMGLNASLSYDPLHSGGNMFSTPSRHPVQNVFSQQKSSSGGSSTQSPSSEEDDEGGFKNQGGYGTHPVNHSLNSMRIRDSGHYMDSSNLSRISVPMPSGGTTVTLSECDKLSPYPNGSYGGSIMSIPNNHGGSQKKRTRHISFV